jgi:ankyrin repeat protein
MGNKQSSKSIDAKLLPILTEINAEKDVAKKLAKSGVDLQAAELMNETELQKLGIAFGTAKKLTHALKQRKEQQQSTITPPVAIVQPSLETPTTITNPPPSHQQQRPTTFIPSPTTPPVTIVQPSLTIPTTVTHPSPPPQQPTTTTIALPRTNLPPLTQSFLCKKHSINAHDFFINYRVSTEGALAEAVAFALQACQPPKERIDKPITVFLDKHCLVDGAGWEEGFLNCLRSATCIVLLVSENALTNIKTADAHPDNVLIEYETAMELSEANSCVLFPVWLGSTVWINDQKLQKKFAGFGDLNSYPDAPHAHRYSNGKRTVRDTIKALFALQGKFCQPEEFATIVPEIMEKMIIKQRLDVATARARTIAEQEKIAETAKQARAQGRTVRADEARRRIAKYVEPNEGTGENSEEFIEACKNGEIEQVHAVLKKGNINMQTLDAEDKYSCLHYAAYYGNVELAKLLMEYGADPRIIPPGLLLAWHLAVKQDRKNVAEFLARVTALDDETHFHALLALCNIDMESHADLQKIFVNMVRDGADIERRNEETEDDTYQFTPLECAIFYGRLFQIRILLEAGARTDDVNPYFRKTVAIMALNSTEKGVAKLYRSLASVSVEDFSLALGEAAAYGNVKLFASFISSGADVNWKNPNDLGFTPLHTAVWNDEVSSVKELLKLGADPRIKNDDGKTATDMARDRGSGVIIKTLETHYTEKGWLDYTSSGNPSLDVWNACQEGKNKLIEKLLKIPGANINWVNSNYYNYSCLHIAVYHGHLDIVNLLLKLGVDVSLKDNYGGNTALDLAKQYQTSGKNGNAIVKVLGGG